MKKQNRIRIAVALAVIGAVLTGVAFTMASRSEHFKSHTVFMSSKETAHFLRADADRYMQGLSIYDLRARKATSHYDYLQKAANSALDFTRDERQMLERCSYLADRYFKEVVDLIHGLDGRAAAAIPWRFAKTANMAYENGLPHTRDNVVFLATHEMYGFDTERITRTLIHEKVHVYQRLYPANVSQYIAAAGYTRSGPRVSLNMIRANPDLDPWYYSIDGKACWYKYSSEHPDSITDCIKYGSSEHPYEEMAYYVAGLYRAGET